MTRDDDTELRPLDGRPGPAVPLSHERQAALIDAAVEAAARARPSPSGRLVWLRRRAALALAAALLLLLGAALAATLPRLRSRPSPPEQLAPPAASESVAPRVTEPPPPEEAPSPSGSAAPAPPKEPPPADLLRLANELRVKHRWGDAEATYQRVIARAPRSDEAYAAEVAAASIHLEHLGDPRTALRLYREALAERPRGSLGEEASYGVAEAERALGDPRAEAAALRSFLKDYPDSVTRPLAERRLAELVDGGE